jgi:hypothetical protein
MQLHRHHLLIAAASVTLAACTPSISSQESARLSREVRPILDAMCANGGSVATEAWPPSLVALEPNAVRVSAGGLYAETWSFMASERGVFVACRPADHFPGDESDPSYHAVTDGVYTYYIAG